MPGERDRLSAGQQDVGRVGAQRDAGRRDRRWGLEEETLAVRHVDLRLGALREVRDAE